MQEVATRLNTTFRKSDGISRLTISRYAGDEFSVLLTNLPNIEQVTWAVKRLLDVINKPVEIGGSTIYLSCHVGVSIYTADANSVDELLNNAMAAKQYCKSQKFESNYQFYDQHMQDLSTKHIKLEKDLRESIENEHWVLYYQPKQDMKAGKIVGAEALIRWDHPKRGLLPPFEFIEFAEKHGLIVSIGNWIIKEAAKEVRHWLDEGVEESGQYDLLSEYSCDEIQGYMLSKPVPSGELLVMLKNTDESANESPIKLIKS